MISKFVIVLLALGLLGLAESKTQARRAEFTEVDDLRQRVIKLESPVDGEARSSGSLPLGELVRLYRQLGDAIDREFPEGKYQIQMSFDGKNYPWASAQAARRTIEGIYTTFRNMQRDAASPGDAQEQASPKQWLKFANTVLSDTHEAVPTALKIMADAIVHNKIFVWAYQEASQQICDTQQSPQQLLYNLYNTIALTEIKGYTMMQFSWTLLKLYNIGNFTEETEQLKQQYAIRTSETLRAVKTAMVFAPREVWKCDPIAPKNDVTYTALRQLFQGYIVNEVDLNSQGSCRENCAYYSYTKIYGCFKSKFCSQQRRCNGKLVNCQFVDSDMWVCQAPKSSDRRYDYVEYENGVKYGGTGKCSNPIKVDSWWRWLFWHCSYCMCTCDDHSANSDRYFNLRDVTSDIERNMVVTGVRLQKINQIVHIQIKEGQLMERGVINPESVAWKPIDNYTILDSGVRSGVDYHTIMWENRAVDLDDLDAPEDHLLTGLRFRRVGAHLNLEIRVTPFNFTSGELMPEKSLWHSHDATEASEVYDLNGETKLTSKRTEVKLDDPDIPTRSLAQMVPDSKHNQFVYITTTSKVKDAAQHSVPFLDIQAVEPKPPVPISGCGIFHKGRQGFGGYFALKLLTYNFEPKLRSELPSAPPVLSNDVNVM